MKAIQYTEFGDADVLKYVELPRPLPGPDEVLIENTAIGVNFPDIRERQGVYNRAETRVGGVQLPQIGGLQVIGHVAKVGTHVNRSLLGRKVMALMQKGAYAEFSLAKAGMTIAIPSHVDDFSIATLAAQGTTAYLALKICARLDAGESVLIQGAAGGVGSLAVQIAKALGARFVIGTASSESRRDFVRTLGADDAIAYDTPEWPKEVLRQTGGRGVDVILESIGGDVFEQNFECLSTFGRYVIVGSTRGPGAPFAPRRLMTNCHTLIGIYLPVFFHRHDIIRQSLDFLASGFVAGKIKGNIAAVLPLSEAAEAHRMLEERRAEGVVVLDPKL